jgi:hypothetical protein
MGGSDNKGKLVRPRRPQTEKPPVKPAAEDDDREDGDIATPKRDRYGEDDEPL